MSDFDDLRGLTDDEDYSDFSFDDIVDDDDEFAHGQEIGVDDDFASTGPVQPGPVTQLIGSMTAQQRLIISAMLFGNILILSVGMLLAFGRLG